MAEPAADRRWLPGVVIGLCCVLVAAGMYLADRPAYTADARDDVHAAADGASWYETRTDDRDHRNGDTAADEVWSVESARYDGLVAQQAADGPVVEQALRPIGTDELERARIWRVVRTSADVDAAQQVAYRRVDDGIVLLAETGGARPRIYLPALVELPSDAKDRNTWQSSGSAGSGIDYRAEFRATAAPGDCLDVRGSVTYSGLQEATDTIERRWCPGQGIVNETISTRSGPDGTDGADGAVSRTAVVRGGSTAAVATAAQPDPGTVRWPEVRSWQGISGSTVSTAPGLGTAAMAEIPGFVPPVSTASGALVRSTLPGGDVRVLRAGTESVPSTSGPADWQAVRRMHPGGDIVSLAAFGDVAVISTTRRDLVAYTSTGFRLWQIRLDDLVRAAPVRSGAGGVVATTVAGTVIELDLRTGAVGWRLKPGDGVETAPAVGSDRVVISDRSGHLTCLDADTGEVRWSGDADAADHLLVDDDHLLIGHGDVVDGIDLAGGNRRWRVALRGPVTGLVPLGRAVLAVSQQGSSLIDHEGRVLAHLDGYQQVTTAGWDADPATNRSTGSGSTGSGSTGSGSTGSGSTGSGLAEPPAALGYDGDRLDLLSADGRVLRSLSTGPASAFTTQLTWLVPDPTGVSVLGSPAWTSWEGR